MLRVEIIGAHHRDRVLTRDGKKRPARTAREEAADLIRPQQGRDSHRAIEPDLARAALALGQFRAWTGLRFSVSPQSLEM